MPEDSFSPSEDPEKVRQEAHGAATSMARLLSDTFYKSDDLLQKIPDTAPAKAELKAIRDNLFIQKNKAEAIVQQATEIQPEPVAPPPPTAPVPAAAPTASVRTAAVPSVAAETVYEGFRKGKEASAGSLATDGKVVTLRGTPIMKNEGGRVLASWGGNPSAAISASVNSLALLAGLPMRPFTLRDGNPQIHGKQASADSWVDLGAMPSSPEPKKASIPALLLRK